MNYLNFLSFNSRLFMVLLFVALIKDVYFEGEVWIVTFFGLLNIIL